MANRKSIELPFSSRLVGITDGRACIMARMDEKSSSIKRLIVLLMSLCVVWTPMVCLSVCASHIEEECEDYSSRSLSVSFTDLDTGCCPIRKSPGEIQEKHSINAGSSLSPVSSTFSAKEDVALRTYTFDIVPPHSPPFERLCILRI
jgi:hypothetical protein